MHILMTVGAMLLISFAMSNRAERAKARERLKPVARRLLPFLVAVWIVILLSLRH